ncbi:thiol S-methyltransferase TMT1B-like [Cloeon dipterum]|uniref:thiol S-methyltransferase TMT1B-like n=1 Tax=Cloeon dipterum TaxID=197152 RepID=UPI0032202013
MTLGDFTSASGFVFLVLLPTFGSLIALFCTVALVKQIAPNSWLRFCAWEVARKSRSKAHFNPELSRIFCELVRRADSDLLILEIGCAGGANLAAFPANSELLMLDINPYCEQYLRKNLEKYSHLSLKQFICGSAEKISQVPSCSVDVVVSSRTLCSLNESKALKEIFRVLKHNGKLVFEEHVLSDVSLWRLVQNFLSLNRISATLFFGCRSNKDIVEAIEKAGFQNLSVKRKKPRNSLVGRLQPYVVGTATKP